MKTVRELADNGYIIDQIYYGNLEGCACGCGGDYYSAKTDYNEDIYNRGVSLLGKHKDQEILDLFNPEVENELNSLRTYLKDGELEEHSFKMDCYIEVNFEIQVEETLEDDDNLEIKKGFRFYLKKEKPLESVKFRVEDLQEEKQVIFDGEIKVNNFNKENIRSEIFANEKLLEFWYDGVEEEGRKSLMENYYEDGSCRVSYWNGTRWEEI